jgi:hypothetical protein
MLGNIIRLAFAVLTIIGLWNMFEKSGNGGWASLIPFYNRFLLFKISDIKNWFWGWLVCYILESVALIAFVFLVIMAFFSGITGSDTFEGIMMTIGITGLVFVACLIYLLVVRIKLAISTARAFALGGGWAVGIFFLPAIFYMIIGVSKDIYYRGIPTASGNVPPYGQNGYGQQGQNPYGQNPYGQNNYQQNQYQQNTYAQNPYQQNVYAQNTAQADQAAPLNPYANNPYMQNQAAQAQPSQPAQSPYASTPDSSQNPYQNPPKQEVWNTIYDENKNNL